METTPPNPADLPQMDTPLKPFDPEPIPQKQSPIDAFMDILSGPMTKQKKILLGGFIVFALVVIGGSFWIGFHGHGSGAATPTPTPTTNQSPTPTDSADSTPITPGTAIDAGSMDITLTPTTTITPTYTPTPGPTNTPTPTNAPFTVTEVKLTSTSSTSNNCTSFTFTGTIYVNAGGQVSYRWENNGNQSANPLSLSFSNVGSQEVTTNLMFNASSSGSMVLRVLQPNIIPSSPLNYTVTCE